ncbi:uncharacterized protein FA14DRAFT_177250 [Meira miltonrushii]|uniref:Uncharacterized protein n=1 Tax=Meira miltonrushii TaxID=1280837 RepID=A0A316VK61_9BASI|nr:uncharacterized protein FA14DRAFT_177250 [Meira miltonrushii]PWN37972.1 hypothetical protein FA14DRAFT_177250 [Meira miltonrushii]
MHSLNVLLLCFTTLFISIEARRRYGSEYSQMLTGKHKGAKTVKWKNVAENPTKRKRNYDSSLIGGIDTLLNIQAGVQTLTSAGIEFVDYHDIDCTEAGARCIQRHTEGVEQQTVSVEALIDTSVECDVNFESGDDYSNQNRFLQCITFQSTKIRVSCQRPSNAYVEVDFQVSSSSFQAENGASARFIFGGIPTGEWQTQGDYQGTSAIVEVYCP